MAQKCTLEETVQDARGTQIEDVQILNYEKLIEMVGSKQNLCLINL